LVWSRHAAGSVCGRGDLRWTASFVVAVAKDAITGIINVVQGRRPMSWSIARRRPIRAFERGAAGLIASDVASNRRTGGSAQDGRSSAGSRPSRWSCDSVQDRGQPDDRRRIATVYLGIRQALQSEQAEYRSLGGAKPMLRASHQARCASLRGEAGSPHALRHCLQHRTQRNCGLETCLRRVRNRSPIRLHFEVPENDFGGRRRDPYAGVVPPGFSVSPTMSFLWRSL
jgi:hypothetical protein